MLSNNIDVEAAMETLELLLGHPIMVIKCAIAKAQAIPNRNSDHLEEWAPFAAKVRNLASAVETTTGPRCATGAHGSLFFIDK